MRILHILHRSVPGTHGYAIRSREIVENQRAQGLEPLVVTSPSQAPQGDLDEQGSEIIGGVRYYRTCGRLLEPTREVHDNRPVRSALRVAQNLVLLKRASWLARTYRPAVIHAHSPFTCGIIGDLIGWAQGIPTVYEVRGIWEDSHVGRFGLEEQSIRYRMVRHLETRAAKGADRCCVICEALRDEMESRGVRTDKLVIVPNGVDVSAFSPGPADPALRRSLNLEGALVIGYIGSFFNYEGLDLLVRSVKPLSKSFPQLRLLLVGGGEAQADLERIARETDVANRVVFTGLVPYDLVPEYYRLIDILVLPRRDTRETRLVTPLKPMEIMAMAKALVASDIGGHREIVVDGVNGLLFTADDVDDLVSRCGQLLKNAQQRTDLGERGRRWVTDHRDWRVLVKRYIELYRHLTPETAQPMTHGGRRSE